MVGKLVILFLVSISNWTVHKHIQTNTHTQAHTHTHTHTEIISANPPNWLIPIGQVFNPVSKYQSDSLGLEEMLATMVLS